MPAREHELKRWEVLNTILEMTERRRFLEIGVQNGNCGVRIRASEKCGVDPEPNGSAPRKYHKFFRGPSDEFFHQLPAGTKFDAVLVDGLHHADQVLRDVNNALECLADDGVIVMHDCNPLTEIAQRVPRQSGVWNGDCWKAMVELRRRDDIDAFTISTDEGVGIVRKRANAAPLRDVPAELTYEALESDRERLLGLVPARQWAERAGAPYALGKVQVVSAIFGGRDEPIPAPRGDVDEYVMFTDGDGAPGWRTIRIEDPGSPRIAARKIKTLIFDHVDGDVVIWVDGRIRVQDGELRPLLRKVMRDVDVAGYPHPWRSCAYHEASECARLGLAPARMLGEQTAAYGAEEFPRGAGLWNTMVLARRRTPEMLALGRAWWEQIQQHTARDQVSFPYLLWRHGIQCGRLGDDVYRAGSSPHFVRGRHVADPS